MITVDIETNGEVELFEFCNNSVMYKSGAETFTKRIKLFGITIHKHIDTYKVNILNENKNKIKKPGFNL